MDENTSMNIAEDSELKAILVPKSDGPIFSCNEETGRVNEFGIYLSTSQSWSVEGIDSGLYILVNKASGLAIRLTFAEISNTFDMIEVVEDDK